MQRLKKFSFTIFWNRTLTEQSSENIFFMLFSQPTPHHLVLRSWGKVPWDSMKRENMRPAPFCPGLMVRLSLMV
jgi:hypothetical protein